MQRGYVELTRLHDRCTRILIAEWVPSLNKGELAILIGMLETFNVLGEVKVSIFSFYPRLDKERYPQDVKIIDVRGDLHMGSSLPEKPKVIQILASLFAIVQHIFFTMLYAVIGDKVLMVMNRMIWREYCRSDVIIICHDQVDCVFGSRKLLLSPIYLTLLAKTLNIPIVFYANGTYKPKSRLWKILARYVLNNVDLITIREEESFKFLKTIAGNKAPIYLTADPAILLSPINHDEARRIAAEEGINRGDDLLIGVTLTRSTLLSAYPEFRNLEDRYNKALTAVAKFFDDLINSINAKIIFLPHCIEHYEKRDDRDVARNILNLMQNKHKVVLITKEYSPQELKGLMGFFDLFIGARVHSVVGALSMGVPSITLTKPSFYTMRPYGIIGGTLNQKDWIYNIENLEPENLLSRIIDLLSLRNEVRKNLVPEIESAKKKALLNGKLLKALLDSRKKSAISK